MTLSDYADSISRIRKEWAQAHWLLFYILEVGRASAVMALVLAVSDVTPLAFDSGQPAQRLKFIVLWAIAVAFVNLLVTRWRGRVKPSLGPPTI